MKEEKLVEGIASLIKIVAIHRSYEVTQAAEGAAMAIITLIGKAYADGLELPEEIERRYVSSFYDEVGACTFTGTYDLDDLIIALRKEEIK